VGSSTWPSFASFASSLLPSLDLDLGKSCVTLPEDVDVGTVEVDRSSSRWRESEEIASGPARRLRGPGDG
jgi:hypothetical protein